MSKFGGLYGLLLMSQNRATQRDRFAAEQDFKVNLKSELMLDELTRNDRDRSVQLEELFGAIKEIQGRNPGEDQGRLAQVAAD